MDLLDFQKVRQCIKVLNGSVRQPMVMDPSWVKSDFVREFGGGYSPELNSTLNPLEFKNFITFYC